MIKEELEFLESHKPKLATLALAYLFERLIVLEIETAKEIFKKQSERRIGIETEIEIGQLIFTVGEREGGVVERSTRAEANVRWGGHGYCSIVL